MGGHDVWCSMRNAMIHTSIEPLRGYTAMAIIDARTIASRHRTSAPDGIRTRNLRLPRPTCLPACTTGADIQVEGPGIGPGGRDLEPTAGTPVTPPHRTTRRPRPPRLGRRLFLAGQVWPPSSADVPVPVAGLTVLDTVEITVPLQRLASDLLEALRNRFETWLQIVHKVIKGERLCAVPVESDLAVGVSPVDTDYFLCSVGRRACVIRWVAGFDSGGRFGRAPMWLDQIGCAKYLIAHLDDFGRPASKFGKSGDAHKSEVCHGHPYLFDSDSGVSPESIYARMAEMSTGSRPSDNPEWLTKCTTRIDRTELAENDRAQNPSVCDWRTHGTTQSRRR